MKTKNILKLSVLAIMAISSGCTKLENSLGSASPTGSGGTSGAAPVLEATYLSLRGPYMNQDRLWCAQEHTSDEAVGPTRGGDWDDNGIWRVLHNHKWDADHTFLRDTYNDLGKIIFNASDVLKSNPTPQQAAEARFLRAFATFSMLDGWDQCPYRDSDDPLVDPKVRSGVEALNWIVAELNAIMNDLPSGGATKANKNAAKVLLMRCLLNKGVYANRANPSFAAADMNQVIALADQIIGSGTYSLTPNYFNNFTPNNDATSTETIFASENLGGSNSGNVRSRWFCTLHYNQKPSGWNGFTTLSDFYDKFEATDKRRGGTAFPNTVIRPGFLIGQQFDASGTALKDRKNNPLSFTRAIALKETGDNLEVTGIRVVKYVPDTLNGDNAGNDYIHFRYADVLLMKAEALLRGGTPTAVAPTTADALVNAVRTSRSATAMTGLTLDKLLDERGREFFWEGFRRTDLIRFGKFLGPKQLKPGTSDPKYLIFPIPNQQLAVNPNLKQNPGY
jgi:starch-binding outer membrane protein, SusD/RagB family